MSKEYFCSYHSYLEAIEPLTDAERGRLWTALLEYSSTGTEPELRGGERYVYPLMKAQIDRDSNKYEKKCEVNRANGSIGGQANAKRTLPNAADCPPNAPQDKDKDEDKDKDKDEENKKESAQARDFEIDAEKGKNKVAQSKRPKNNYESMITAYTEDEGVRKALWEYLKMRTKKRATPTDHAFELILKHLSEMSLNPDEQIAILNKSIISNWTDIFPLKPQTGGTNNGQPNRELSDWSDRKSSERTVTQNNGNNDESQYGKTY